jgi:hypothetical protein
MPYPVTFSVREHSIPAAESPSVATMGEVIRHGHGIVPPRPSRLGEHLRHARSDTARIALRCPGTNDHWESGNRQSSSVTRSASGAAPPRSCTASSVSSRGPWSRRRYVCPGVSPALLRWPARHTPHDARMLPACGASTDGTRGRPHRSWGVCARALRQRPAGRCLRIQGIAMAGRHVIHGVFLSGHPVLRHPIRHHASYPISHSPDILCGGFSDAWDRYGDT